jgi:cation transporter-like permease
MKHRPKHSIFYTIFIESSRILVFTAIINTFGGVSIEAIQDKLFALLPFLIMLTPLNGLIGSFGTIISSKFTTYLYMGQITDKHWYHAPVMKKLMWQLTFLALFASLYLSTISFAIAAIKGFEHGLWFTLFFLARLIMATMFTTFILLLVLIFVSTLFGWYIYKQDRDPDNYLIPITTTIADLGTMMLFAGTIFFLF